MSDQKLTDKKFKFDDKDLDEQIKAPTFKIEDREKFRFEDKKAYIVLVETDKEIVMRETPNFGIKYIVFVTILKTPYYWECSAKTLRQIKESLQTSEKLNVQLNAQDKKYSIIPVPKE